jgi:hypothetical protein
MDQTKHTMNRCRCNTAITQPVWTVRIVSANPRCYCAATFSECVYNSGHPIRAGFQEKGLFQQPRLIATVNSISEFQSLLIGGFRFGVLR